MDALRLTVVWHPRLACGQHIAEAIAETFDRLGMVRDDVCLSVPVQVRSMGFDELDREGAPRPIDFSKAQINGLILLSDRHMVAAASRKWKTFFDSISEEKTNNGAKLFIINVAADGKGVRLPFTEEENVIKTFAGSLDSGDGSVKRLLFIKLIASIVINMKKCLHYNPLSKETPPRTPSEVIFLSYASQDGAEIAGWIDKYVRVNKASLGIDTFLDENRMPGGLEHRPYFSDQIRNSSLLVIYTDAYSSREYCRWELLEAKRHRRPILAIWILERGEDRVFPYAGNIPSRIVRRKKPARRPLWKRLFRVSRRAAPIDEADAELAVQELLSEVLRFQVFKLQAEEMAKERGIVDPIILPRPPELLDIAFANEKHRPGSDAVQIIYPDPPLDTVEQKILRSSNPAVAFKSLSEL
jgi:hypothetical protein